jgi:hypothetical protein
MRVDERDFDAAGQAGDPTPDRVDALMDAALRSYAEPQAIPDARTAALTLLERGKAKSRPKWPLWIWAIPVAVCLIILAAGATWLARTPRIPEVARTPAPARTVAQAKPPAPWARNASVTTVPKRSPHFAVVKSQPLPKLEVFPTPTPLSPQEEALAAFVKYGPPAVQRAVIEDQKHWDDPIIVADLREQPVQAGNPQDQ